MRRLTAVAATWCTSTRVPTALSPASKYGLIALSAAFSIAMIMTGVESTAGSVASLNRLARCSGDTTIEKEPCAPLGITRMTSSLAERGQYRSQAISADRLFLISRGEERMTPGPAAVTPVISISGLTKTYASGLQALKNVRLEIRRGEIFALLGPNGAGKTTLINIVCGIVTPSGGTVLADGHDIVRDYRVTRS